MWVDGAPRVACVTAAKRVSGRTVTTLDGLGEQTRLRYLNAFLATGASQCGFCTPGIIMRLAALEGRGPGAGAGAAAGGAGSGSSDAVAQALLAHLCRCTGWNTIKEAAALALSDAPTAPAASDGNVSAETSGPPPTGTPPRDLAAAAARAGIEGRTPQTVSADVVAGRGGFSDDLAPADALVAVPGADGEWAVAETLSAARAAAGKVQGRRSTIGLTWPLDPPPGDWDLTLSTTWVEPAYLETDASWCAPGGEPASPLANGGAFGAKLTSAAATAARELADRHGRAVRVVLSREDTVRMGPKRPPLALGLRADGTGAVRVVRTAGVADVIRAYAPSIEVEEVDVPGPPTSTSIRGAGWMEVAAALGVLRARAAGLTRVEVVSPEGARASAELVRVGDDAARGDNVSRADDAGRDRLRVEVACGPVLDAVTLRSYCIGAAHMALGWVRSEGLAVDADGVAHDLTIRSFGILRARDMPEVDFQTTAEAGPPLNASEPVMAAVAGAVWLAEGFPPRWPHQ